MKQSRKDYRKSELEKSIQLISDNQEAISDITIETRLAIEMATSYSKGGDVIRSDEVPRIFQLLTDRIKELEGVEVKDKLSEKIGIYIGTYQENPPYIEWREEAVELEKLVNELMGTLREIVEIEDFQPLRAKGEHGGSVPNLVKAYIQEINKYGR